MCVNKRAGDYEKIHIFILDNFVHGESGKCPIVRPGWQNRNIRGIYLPAGYGFSNGSFPVDRVAVKSFNTVNVWVISAGGGIKVPINKSVLLRGEYRFQKFRGSGTEVSSRGFSEQVEVDIDYSFFWIGFSVLL